MTTKIDFLSLTREIGPDFASRAAAHDADDSFVAENFAILKERGFLAGRRRRDARGDVCRPAGAGSPLQLDSAGLFDAHPPRGSGNLALEQR